jgi:hypothetical protein
MGEVDFNLYFPDYPTGRRKILYGILASARQFESESFQFGVAVLQGPGAASLGDRCPKFRKSVVVSPSRVEMSKDIYSCHLVRQYLLSRLALIKAGEIYGISEDTQTRDTERYPDAARVRVLCTSNHYWVTQWGRYQKLPLSLRVRTGLKRIGARQQTILSNTVPVQQHRLKCSI